MTSMLPAPPKSFGMLGEVLISSLKSILGEPNALKLPKKKSIVVILVDGLGSENLKVAGAHAGFLNSLPSDSASCFFPSTTASSLVSFSTGRTPSESGFIGYQVYSRNSGSRRNLLNGWASAEEAEEFQKLTTVSEVANEQGVQFHTVAPSAYKNSGFTAATMRGAMFHGTRSIAERFDKALEILREGSPKIIYLYVPELDQIAHAKGWRSRDWLTQLEDLDSYVASFIRALKKSDGVIVTADHGVVDVDVDNHIYLDLLIDSESLLDVGGDTRALFLYLKSPEASKGIIEDLQGQLASSCFVVTPETLQKARYWGHFLSQDVVPDVVILAKKEVALYHRIFAKKKSLEMIGHHGSITSQEMSIPLIKIGF